MTLTGGLATGVAPANVGGAIFAADEQIALQGCVLPSNKATDGGAVGVYSSGTLSAMDCTFTNNSAADGGAIRVYGTGTSLTVRRCTVSGNTAFNGGGLYGTHYMLVADSTLTGNSAVNPSGGGSGGAIQVYGVFAAGALTIRNSTISTNKAAIYGGGVNLFAINGTLLVQNSTITGNGATTGGGINAQVAAAPPVITL